MVTDSPNVRAQLRSLPSLVGDPRAFDPAQHPSTPQELFTEWFREALDAGVPEPHAMTLARTSEPAARPVMVAFAAPSGTGKTTFITKLSRALIDRGYAVAAVKHDAHRIELDTEGDVPGLDAKGFAEHAETAKKNCPVSVALAGVQISLNARLL